MEWLPVSVGCAVAGAASFGLASAAQERATKAVPDERALHPRLLVRLVRQPMWLAGTLAVGVGLALQIVALAFGPLVLVQPIGVTSALFGAIFATAMARRPVARTVVVGAMACAGGLALLLLSTRPNSPTAETEPHHILPLAIVLLLVLLTALAVAKARAGEVRVLALALAAGICYGVTAGLLKVITAQVRAGGIGEPFAHWSVYAVCVTGPPGFLLSQNAFQQGRLVSSALAVITTVDPLVAIVVGVGWLGERVDTTPVALAGAAVGAVAIVGGVAVLARYGERLRHADVPAGTTTGGSVDG